MQLKRKRNFINNLLLICGFIFFLSEALTGLIRYYLFKLGVIQLVYLPKILLILSIFLFLSISVFKGKLYKSIIFFFMLILTSLLTAIFFIRNSIQIIFGFYILVPFIYGIIIGPILLKDIEKYKKYIFILWFIAIVGVFINFFYKWPWIGFSYELGKIQIEGTRDWSTGGLERLAGFGRISAATAGQILISSLVLVLTYSSSFFKNLIWFLSGLAIILTTTKTTIVIWLFLTFLLVFSKIFGLKLLRPLPFLLSLIVILLPFSTLFFKYKLNIQDFYTYLLLASFEERLTYTWPMTLNLITNHGNLILGRGIGGIGTYQRYFEANIYSPADNLSLYLYAIFGLSGILLLIILGVLSSLKTNNSIHGRLIFYLSVACLLEGITLSVMESAFFATCLGVVFSLVFLKKKISIYKLT